MLEPNKYTDYKTSVVSVAAAIIQVLQDRKNEKYSVVMRQVQNMIGEESKYEFQNSVNFLFLLGKIDYYCDKDVLALTV